MYKYDKYDQAMVDARVAEFRDQVARRIAGDLTEDQFKPLRLKNGLYLQLHAYMLRVAIPYGTLSAAQMRHAGRYRATSTIAATATSPRARTSSTTGSSWPTLPTFSPISRRSRCMRSRPAATASATSARDHYRRGGRRRDGRSAPLCRAAAPVVELPPGVRLPAAQVQDRGHRQRDRPRGDEAARHRHPHRAQ